MTLSATNCSTVEIVDNTPPITDSSQILVENHDFCRAMLCTSAACAVMRCLAVCHIRRFCLNEYTYLQIFNFHNKSWQYSDGDTLTGASNAGGVGTTTNIDEYMAIGSITAAVRTTTATVDCAVYRTDHQTSVNLVYHATVSVKCK